MSKKTLTIIILFILMLAGVAGYLYLLLHNKATPTPSTSPTPLTSANIFPFGSPTVDTPDAMNGEGATPTPLVSDGSTLPRLEHISLSPIAGAMATTTASSTVIRYVDRGTGHVIERNLEEQATRTLSNTTIPQIYEAYWNKNGTSMLLRYLTELDASINTFSVSLSPVKSERGETLPTSNLEKAPFEIKGTYLSNVKNVALSPKTDHLFFISTTASGATAYESTLGGGNKKQIWSSPLSNWQIEWPEEKSLAVTTAATGLGTGFSYLIDSTNGKVRKVLGPVTGLTTRVSKDAKKILYSESQGQVFATGLYDVTTGLTQKSTFRTLPEKCVWSTLTPRDLYCAVPIGITNALYPDDWYKGKVSFTDQIWYINTETGDAHLLSNLYADSKDIIDVINPTLDNEEEVLLFTNKNDLTLWSLRIH